MGEIQNDICDISYFTSDPATDKINLIAMKIRFHCEFDGYTELEAK